MKTFFSAIIIIGIICFPPTISAQNQNDNEDGKSFHAGFCADAANDSSIIQPEELGASLYYFPCNGTRFNESYKVWIKSFGSNYIAHLQPCLINLHTYEIDKKSKPDLVDHMLGIRGWYVTLEPLTYGNR